MNKYIRPERYSIEVHEEVVMVWGTITSDEARKILEFYASYGYCFVILGDENSTMRLSKVFV